MVKYGLLVLYLFPGGAAVARDPVKIKVVGSNPTRGAILFFSLVGLSLSPPACRQRALFCASSARPSGRPPRLGKRA